MADVLAALTDALTAVVEVLNHYVWSFPAALPWMVVVLLGTGIYVTFRLRFIQLRRVGHAIAAILGRFDNPEDEGDISHFQALSTALSATVGIGNIAGVALAIHYGGPGALFWMWVTAIFGMALKYAECTLSMHYRAFDDRGGAAGGPMYYIELGLGRRWKPLAVFFAVCTIVSSFGSGNMNQANTVALSARTSFGIPSWLVGLVSAALVAAVILGGIKRIGRVTSKLAPFMASVYIAGALLVMVLEYDKVPGAFAEIFRGAFSPQASLGGSVAGVFSLTLLWGIKRGLFSNEAGQGSAPIAHAAARTREPAREGAVALLGPLIDTLLICTMTGLIIVITGVWDEKRPGSIRLGEVSVYPSALVPAEAPSEAARIHSAQDAIDAAQARLKEADRAARRGLPPSGDEARELEQARQQLAVREVAVQDGRARELVFGARQGIVEAPELVERHEGTRRPFSGRVRHDPAAATIEPLPAEPGAPLPELHLRGTMLRTSSALTAWAFERGLAPLGGWGSYVVTFSVFLFALSTMISWSYYGDRCVEYLVGSRYVTLYRVMYVGFVFVGSIAALELVWDYGDLAIGLMAVPNLIAVALLMPEVVRITRDYFQRMQARGSDEKR